MRDSVHVPLSLAGREALSTAANRTGGAEIGGRANLG